MKDDARKKAHLRSIKSQSDIIFFLVGRLVIVVVMLLLSEIALMIFDAQVLFPKLQELSAAAGLSAPGNTGILGALEMLGQAILAPGFVSAAVQKTVFLSLFMIFLFLIPIFAGVFLFAYMTSSWVKEDRAAIQEEHERYDRQKMLLLSDMAHDLRTPIQTIEGYAKALNDGMVTDPEKQKEYLQAIGAKSEHLSELINLLFDYVKVGSEGYHLNLAPADFNELLRTCAAEQYTDFEERGMELTLEVPDEPWIVTMDEAQVKRVISNLLINVQRHNPAGTKVCIKVIPRAGLREVCVMDSGVPIAGDTAAIFEPFVKEDASRTGENGSGLGLSIAKKIVEMHEGWTLTLVQPSGDYTKAFVIRVPDQ